MHPDILPWTWPALSEWRHQYSFGQVEYPHFILWGPKRTRPAIIQCRKAVCENKELCRSGWVIGNSVLFIGNQSSCFAIAEGDGAPKTAGTRPEGNKRNPLYARHTFCGSACFWIPCRTSMKWQQSQYMTTLWGSLENFRTTGNPTDWKARGNMGIEGRYVNKMTTVLFWHPHQLYGPDKPTPPDPKQLRPLDRLVKATFVAGKELCLFRLLQRRHLARGTIVIHPRMETIKTTGDDPLIKEMFPDVIPAFAAPFKPLWLIATKAQTLGVERGYGGWVMLENVADLLCCGLSTLELEAVQQSRQTVRKWRQPDTTYTPEGSLMKEIWWVLPNFRD